MVSTHQVNVFVFAILVACRFGAAAAAQEDSFLSAILRDDIQEVTTLLASGLDVNCEFSGRRCPMHIAKSPQMIRLLLLNKASLESMTERNKLTPIEYHAQILASTKGNVLETAKQYAILYELLQAGAIITERTAVWIDDPEYFREKILSPDEIDSLMKQALTQRGDRVVRFLLTKGANPNGITRNDPLLAYALGDSNLMNILLQAGADVKGRVKLRGGYSGQEIGDFSTVLHVACRIGCIESARSLLKYGADPNAQDANGHTPLHTLATFEQFSDKAKKSDFSIIARLFLTNAACIELTDKENRTAMDVAIENGASEELIELLRPGGEATR